MRLQKKHVGERKSPHERAEFQMVEATGFEPVTSWSRTKRATKLHHASMTMRFYSNLNEMTTNKLSKKAPEGASFALSLSIILRRRSSQTSS